MLKSNFTIKLFLNLFILLFFSLNFSFATPCTIENISNNFNSDFNIQTNSLNIYENIFCENGFDFSNQQNLNINCGDFEGNIRNINFNNSILNISNSTINFEFCNFENLDEIFDNENSILNFLGKYVNTNNFKNQLEIQEIFGSYNISRQIRFDNLNSGGSVEHSSNLSQIFVKSQNPFFEKNFTNTHYPIFPYFYKNSSEEFIFSNFELFFNSSFFGSNLTFNLELNQSNNFTNIFNDVNPPNLLLGLSKTGIPYFSEILVEETDFIFSFVFDELVQGSILIYDNQNIHLEIPFNTPIYGYVDWFDENDFDLDKDYTLSFYNISDLVGNSYQGDNLTFRLFEPNISSSEEVEFLWTGFPNKAFIRLYSPLFNAKVSFKEPFNLNQEENISNKVLLSNYSINVIDPRYNSSAFIEFFNINLLKSTPKILKNGNFCPEYICFNQNIYSNYLIFEVDSFSNYSLTPNSSLLVNYSSNLVDFDFNISVNFSYFNSNETILNSTCSIFSPNLPFNINLTFNPISQLHETTITSFSSNLTLNFNISCSSPNAFDRDVLSQHQLEYHPLDSIETLFTFKPKSQVFSKVTNLKEFNLSIIPNGTNNSDLNNNIYYEIMVSKDITYPQTGWNTSNNITNWINIGKSEFITLKTQENSSFTFIELQNGSVINISEYIFIDKRDSSNNGISLFITTRVCANENFCSNYYSNDENNVIFEDTTPPILAFPIQVNQFLNSLTHLNFSFLIFDYESKINNIFFGVGLNSSPIPQKNPILFNQNEITNISLDNLNLQEGRFYLIYLRAVNNILLSSTIFNSISFLVDTIAPINSSINLSEPKEFFNQNQINISLFPGEDYNLNYSSQNLVESGLDFMQIYVHKSNLFNTQCINSNFFEKELLLDNLSEFNTSIELNLTEDFCYNLTYVVYDRASNFLEVKLNQSIKVDTNPPQINLINGREILDFTLSNPNNADNINFNPDNLNDLELFRVRWNLTDNISGIKNYYVELIDDTLNEVIYYDYNFSEQEFIVEFNSSYIFDNHNYKVRVWAENNAGLNSTKITTNGAFIFLNSIPKVWVLNSGILSNNSIITNQNFVNVSFEEKRGINVSCRLYLDDIGYDPDSGVPCLSYGSYGICENLNTQLNYSISCMSTQSVKESETFQNQSNNFDLNFLKLENSAPFIETFEVDGFTFFNNQINVFENDSVNIIFNLKNNNSNEILLSTYTLNLSNNLLIFNGTNDVAENLIIEIINNSNINEPILNRSGLTYILQANNSINISQIKTLLDGDFFQLIEVIEDNSNSVDFGVYYFNLLNKTPFFGTSNSSKLSFLNSSDYPFVIFNEYNSSFQVNISDFNLRKGIINLSFNISDFFNSTQSLFQINISPIIKKPYLNLSYFNLLNNSLVYTNKPTSINLLDLFLENNTNYGLEDNLTFKIESQDINLISFNQNSNVLNFTANKISNITNLSLNISVSNILNQSIYSRIYFNSTQYIIKPLIGLNSPLIYEENDNFFSFVNITSDNNLESIRLNINSIPQTLCNFDCSNSFEQNIFLLGLKNGSNILELVVTDIYGNSNNISENLYFNWTFNFSKFENNSVIGNKSSIYSNQFDLDILINNSSNLSQNFSQNYLVEFKDNQTGNKYVEFNFDFSSSKLDLSQLRIFFSNSSEEPILGVSRLNISSKNIYIPQSENLNFSTLCILNQPIDSLEQISENCSNSNEVKLKCPGTINGIGCSSFNQNSQDFWRVSNLQHTIVKIVENEIVTPPPTSSPSNGGGGSSGGGGGSSSGGSSSSSSSTIISTPQTNQTQNDTIQTDLDDQSNQNSNSEAQITQLPLFKGNLDNNNLDFDIENNNNYSFNFQNNLFVISKKENQLNLIFPDKSIKELNYGQTNIIYQSENVNLSFIITVDEALNSISINKIQENINKEIINQENFNSNNSSENDIETISQKNNNFLFLSLFSLFILILIFGFIFFFKNKKEKTFDKDQEIKLEKFIPQKDNRYSLNELNEKNFNTENLNSNFTQNNQETIKPIQNYSYETLTDMLVLISENSVNLILSNKQTLHLFKNNLKTFLDKGYSWIDIYYSLKEMGISDITIKQIINFEDLIKNIKRFISDNKFRNFSQKDLEQEFISQTWIKDCFISQKNKDDIFREIMFLIAGVKIYGFSKERFANLFEEEFSFGKSLQNKSNIKLEDFNFLKNDINKIKEFDINLNLIHEKILLIENELSSNLLTQEQKEELRIIIEKMKKNL